MRLEKMNDQQIRFTLNSEDLAARKIKLSELAYGTEKARSLFNEMMHLAEDEFNFETDNMPIMIEAVPTSSDSIVLTVTKVDDPEELDTRFAQFAPSLLEENEDESDDEFDMYGDMLDGSADELSELFQKISEAGASKSLQDIALPAVAEKELVRLFSFDSMDAVISVSKIIINDYVGDNSLYKDNHSGKYLILLHQSDLELVAFNRICNIISEYGNSEKNLLATSAYLEEHCDVLISKVAIQKLSTI